MSRHCDDQDMGRDQGLDDRRAEQLLRGHAAEWAEEPGLADVLAQLRQQASGPAPNPSDELWRIFSEGVRDPALDPVGVRAAESPAGRRRPALARRTAARVAGLSLAVKLILAGLAVGAAAAGVGATSLFPGFGDGPSDDLPAPEVERDHDVADETGEGLEHAPRTRDPRSPADAPVGDQGPEPTDEPGEPGLEEAGEHTDEAPATVPRSREDGRDRADERTGDHPRSDDRPGSEHRAPTEPRNSPAPASPPAGGGPDAEGAGSGGHDEQQPPDRPERDTEQPDARGPGSSER